MVGLLDGGLASIFGAAFGGLYLPAVLHRATPLTYDAGGTVIGGGWTDALCRAQLDAVTEAMRQADGFTDKDQRILVLAATLAGDITTADEITVAGQRWAIASVARDPADTYHELRGVRA